MALLKYGNNFVNTIINKSKSGENLKVINDQRMPNICQRSAEVVMQIIESDKKIDKKRKFLIIQIKNQLTGSIL